jgi:hypothetical protein
MRLALGRLFVIAKSFAEALVTRTADVLVTRSGNRLIRR